jgi:hypothetical protein
LIAGQILLDDKNCRGQNPPGVGQAMVSAWTATAALSKKGGD